MRQVWRASTRMWALQGRVRPLVISAAFGEQQRGYRPSGGSGGGRGTGRGSGQRGRGGTNNNQRWGRRDDRGVDDTDSPQGRGASWGRGGGRGGGGRGGRGRNSSSGRGSSFSPSTSAWKDTSTTTAFTDSTNDRRGGYDPRNDNFFSGDDDWNTDFSSEFSSSKGRTYNSSGGGGYKRDTTNSSGGGGGRGYQRAGRSTSSYNSGSREDRGGSGRGGRYSQRGDRERSQYSPGYGYRDIPAENDDADSSDADSSYYSNSGGPSLRDTWIADVVYGVSPVLAALESGRRKIHTLYLQDGLDASSSEKGGSSGRKEKGAVAAATARAKDLGASIRSASKHDLNMICGNRPHQGMVLDASELDFESLDAMPEARVVWDEEQKEAGVAPPIWLCLDEVVDPQNFGAALRSAFFLGAAGVLTCRRNSAPLSPVVSKASSGALELMPVHSCRSLPQTLADARQRGWTVLGAAAQADAISCSQYSPQGPTILVMGNEGYGLRTTVRQQCDAMLRIDGGGGTAMGSLGILGIASGSNAGEERAKRLRGMVDSLNVSVATGILMHQLLKPN